MAGRIHGAVYLWALLVQGVLWLVVVTVAELSTRLDLGECDSREDLVEKLQSVRAFHLETLERGFPECFTEETCERLRVSRLNEIALCEEALSGFSEPFEVAPC